jgi:D-threo-aldose 1-dehydrogenase
MPDRVPALGRLGFGGANLGNLFTAMSDEQAHAVLEAAWECGIRYFDTAPHYGLGLSERRLGAFLATKPRDEFVVSTKVGRRLVPSPETSDELDEEGGFIVPADPRRVWDPSPDGVRRSLDESLDRLGLDRIDVLFLHDPDEYPDMEASVASAVPTLVALRDEGLVRAVGLGSKSVPAHPAAVRAGDVDVLMVAGRYTLLEQPAAPELIPQCRERHAGRAAGHRAGAQPGGPRDPRWARALAHGRADAGQGRAGGAAGRPGEGRRGAREGAAAVGGGAGRGAPVGARPARAALNRATARSAEHARR